MVATGLARTAARGFRKGIRPASKRKASGYKNAEVSCKSNDAFATVKISLKTESEENYAQVLDFLCRLPGYEFPRSYAIAFRSPEKRCLPVKGLPKKASTYGKIEDYARLAMREYEWYNARTAAGQNLRRSRSQRGQFALAADGESRHGRISLAKRALRAVGRRCNQSARRKNCQGGPARATDLV
jgi:hypothetical protein